MGFTASIILQKESKKTYRGIELNKEAAERLSKTINNGKYLIINTSASSIGLENKCADTIIEEAMLTMQADHRKEEIMGEVFRILKPGGMYGIHELGLIPDNIEADVKKDIQVESAQSIKVNARPLIKDEWCNMLKKAGFKIKSVHSSPMHLLKLYRIIEDEGLLRTIKIIFNIFAHPKEKEKILAMRKVFAKYDKQITAFAIIAQKH